MPFGGRTYDRLIDGPWMKTQLYHVLVVMCDGRWRTPEQISDDILSRFGKRYKSFASLTARVRDFRKGKFGSHEVNVRRVEAHRSLQEYQLILNPKTVDILFERMKKAKLKKPKPRRDDNDPLADYQPTRRPN